MRAREKVSCADARVEIVTASLPAGRASRTFRAWLSNPRATPGDLRESVATLEGLIRTARRVLGDAHPAAMGIGESLRAAREVLRREPPDA